MAIDGAKLIGIDGAAAGVEIALGEKTVVVGRDPSCDVVLTDGGISRRHAQIEPTEHGFAVVDLGSANGTFVGDARERVARHELADGDVVRFGRVSFRASIPAPAAASEGTQILSTDSEKTSVLAPGAVPPPAPLARPEATLRAQRPSDQPIVLTVLLGPDRGMVYSPPSDLITIGRFPNCDVPLTDPTVSRMHATIKREGTGYVLYDESTRNGTWLGEPESRAYHADLRHGDVFRVGGTRIRVDLGGEERSQPDDRSIVAGRIGEQTFTMTVKGLLGRPAAAEPPGEPEPPPAPPAPIAALVVTAGPDAGRRFEWPGGRGEIVVGRGGDADVVLSDSSVSTRHFSLRKTGEGFALRDENSRNGTFVRGATERATETPIAFGDAIHVGASDLRLEPPAAAAEVGTATTVAPAPVARSPVAPAAVAPAAVPPAGTPAIEGAADRRAEPVPELARSAEAKQRISKIMKGVSLRPARTPGTPRQWATLAVVLACALASLGLAWRWPSLLAAGPLYEGHADLDQAESCSTCHVEAGWAGTPHLAMSAGCSTTDCHADALKVKENVVDDCVSCHTDHRGRAFPIRGGETLCWSCHLGSEEVRDYGERPMRAVVATAPDEREAFLARVARVETGLRFSHTAHDLETKGDPRFDQCLGCHADVDEGRTFTLPGHAACIECHDSAVSADVEVAKKSAGPQCLECHTREDGEIVEPPARPFGYVEFAHRDHANEFCKSCHAEIWNEGDYAEVIATDLYPVAMDACYTCHEQKGATVACLDCHREHHSFPATEVAAAAGRSTTTLPLAFAGLVALSLFGFGYVYTDMVLVRRWLGRGDAPPPAAAPGGGAAPAGDAPKGEILPFPRVDVEACISCSSCYNSCPKQVLAGDEHGKSQVVNPDSCIAQEGCAVCEQGCPTGAIRVSTAPLVRTVERPDTDEHLEAKPMPGLFFVGEVIGAALIKSAVNQGADVIRYIQTKKKTVAGADYDVVVVGAGPGGLGAALEAKAAGLKYLVLERDTVASTIRAYPRDKAVLAEPIKVPLYGKLPMMDADKDELIAVWETVVKSTGLVVQEHEEVTDVRRDGEVLVVKTRKGEYRSANVVLAIGTRGNPRRLGCAGEEPSCVSYLLIDAAEWTGKSVLVVGGGDSAIEAAVALGKGPGTTVRLSYRKNAFARVKKRNVEQIDELAKAGRIEILWESTVKEVGDGRAVLETKAGPRTLDCVHVFALIGADPPRGWIEKIGVPFVEKEEAVVSWS